MWVPPTALLSSYVIAGLTTCSTRVGKATRGVNPVTVPNDDQKAWDEPEGYVPAVVHTLGIATGMIIAFCCINVMTFTSMEYRTPINLSTP